MTWRSWVMGSRRFEGSEWPDVSREQNDPTFRGTRMTRRFEGTEWPDVSREQNDPTFRGNRMTRRRVPEERNLQTHLHKTSRFTQEWLHGGNKIFCMCCTAALTNKVCRLILQLNGPQNRNKKTGFCRRSDIKRFTWMTLQLKSATEIFWWRVCIGIKKVK
jgi:hypothetical protein